MKTTTKSIETRGTNLINKIRSLRNEGREEEAKRLLRQNYIEINAKDIEFYEGEGESRYYIKVKGEALDWSDDSINRLLAETIENHIDSNEENAQTAKLQSLLERSGYRHGYHNSLGYEPLAEAMDTAFGVGAWCVCDKFTELVTKATDLLYSKLDDLDTFEPLYLMNNYTEPINYYGEPEEAWGLYASPNGYKLVRKGLCYLTIPYGTKPNPENPLACEWAWNAEATLMDCGLWQNHINHVLHEVATRLTHLGDHLGWDYETEQLVPLSAITFEETESGDRIATMWACRASNGEAIVARRGDVPNSYERIAWADSDTLATDLMEAEEDFTEAEASLVADLIREVVENGLTID